jgi:hypothetical protein
VPDILMIGEFTLVIAAVKILFVYVGGRIFTQDASKNFLVQLVGFLMSGALAGGVLAFALFEANFTAILQGVTGGVIAAALIGLMVPARLSSRMSATLTGEAIEGVR